MELAAVMAHVLDAIVAIDASREPFRCYQPGVGPYGDPQLVKLIARVAGVSQKDVEIVSGERSRRKRVQIRGLEASDVLKRFETSLL